jgi:hypothetical protein
MREISVVLAVLFLLSVVAGDAWGQNLVVNGSFENPSLSPGVAYQYQPPSSDWYYSGGAGISNANGEFVWPPWDGVPDGKQFCFVQGAGNYVSEQVVFPASGHYELNYYAGGRYDNGDPQIYGGDTNYGLILDSTFLGFGTTTSNTAMTEQEPLYFSTAAGTHTLELLVTSTPLNEPADEAALFDAVSITLISTPEPSTLTLLSVGVVCLAGYAWRRRQKRTGKSTLPDQDESEGPSILSMPTRWTEAARRAA